MVATSLMEQIVTELEHLAVEEQQEVLNFTRSLAVKKLENRGVTLGKMLRHTGKIPPDDLEHMAQAIEECCEQVDPETWDIDLDSSQSDASPAKT